eukprot:TRINITY_DN1857_c1_g1_i2.p1 TRINITY_DN1857_c1_g1~~TRINITY_DN1857_c1_g1_i2.p1  ORF type:complete len:548 (-),score=99.87 TRINITY_DN1857_c1_g1_i2:235-1878(-)
MSHMVDSSTHSVPIIFTTGQVPSGCQLFVFLQNVNNANDWTQGSPSVAATYCSNINSMSNFACVQNYSFQGLPNIEGKMWNTSFLEAGADFSNINNIGDFAVCAQNEAFEVSSNIEEQMWHMQSHVATEQEQWQQWSAFQVLPNLEEPTGHMRFTTATEQEQQRGYESRTSAIAKEDSTAQHAPDDALEAWTGGSGLAPAVAFVSEALEDHMTKNPEYELPNEPSSATKLEQVPALSFAKGSHQALTHGHSTSHEFLKSLTTKKDFATKIAEELGKDTTHLIKWMLPELRQLSLSSTTTHAVQKAIAVADSKLQKEIIAELEPYAIELYESPAGNYVLQKLVEACTSDSLQGVRKVLENKGWEEIAKHRYGCRVLERFVEQTSKMEELQSLFAVIEARAVPLSCHKYAHHVVKRVLEHFPVMRGKVLASILPQTCTMAMKKYGSWLVQKALDHSDRTSQGLIVQAFLDSESPTLEKVACDEYGSHVAAQLAKLSDQILRNEISRRFDQSRDILGSNRFGLRVLESFKKILEPSILPATEPEPEPPQA